MGHKIEEIMKRKKIVEQEAKKSKKNKKLRGIKNGLKIEEKRAKMNARSLATTLHSRKNWRIQGGDEKLKGWKGEKWELNEILTVKITRKNWRQQIKREINDEKF